MSSLKHIILPLLLLSGYKCYSQENIYFSSTGDTVLFYFGGTTKSMRMDTIDWVMIVSTANKAHACIDTISSFLIRTTKPGHGPFMKVDKDTLLRYNLEYDGEELSLLDYETSIEPIKVKLIKTNKNTQKNLYHAHIRISVKYESQRIGTIDAQIMFIGKSEKDIDYEDICFPYAWKKRNKNKFFFQFRLKSYSCQYPQMLDCLTHDRIVFAQF